MSRILDCVRVRKAPRAYLVAIAVAAAASAAVFFGASPARSTITKNGHHYGLFDRPGNPGDLAPNNWRVSPNAIAADRPTLGLKTAGTRVLRRERMMTLAAIPSTDGGCLLESFADGSEGMECTRAPDPPTAFISAGKAVGLVPDGVESVTFHMTDGNDVVNAVTDNTYSAPAEAETVRFTVDGDVKVIDL